MLDSSQLGAANNQFGHFENASFANTLFEPMDNRSKLDCDNYGDICQPCGRTAENDTWPTTQCSIACLDQDYFNRRGKVEFEIANSEYRGLYLFAVLPPNFAANKFNLPVLRFT